MEEKDTDKVFKQGITTCYRAFASRECRIPRRFKKELDTIRRRDDLVIMQADNGSGVVILNKADYNKKMSELLSDGNTYMKMQAESTKKEAENFKKKARKILTRNEDGKALLGLLEEAPKLSRMRGLPKVHRPGVPMRPITSGIDNAPHRLAKRLAKPLSAALGTISDSLLRNSSNLIHRLKLVNFEEKKMASFDVKSLIGFAMWTMCWS